MKESILIYDCEIIRAIPPKDDFDRLSDIEYCDGWHDHANMGISVITAYDYYNDKYRVFLRDNFDEFQNLVDNRSFIAGFNSLAFDNKLCAANNINVPDEKSYDLLVEMWIAAGLAPKFSYPTHTGYGLDKTCMVNFGCSKTGNGALAPVLWQRGDRGLVIDYGLNDSWLTKKLMDLVIYDKKVQSPVVRDQFLSLRNPLK